MGCLAPRAFRPSLPREASPCDDSVDSAGSSGGAAIALEMFPGDGLLHDARNLVSAIGLYCDLLSMPGVLKLEHRKYSDELRLLGTRSQQMIEHLMDSLAARQSASVAAEGNAPERGSGGHQEVARRPAESGYRAAPVGLRSIVERCKGLLSRVSNGRVIEVIYGPAAEMPIRIAEESVERILVNLVRNGSAALGEERGPIRISVGLVGAAAGETRAWPFERVRLVVEDAGCGMEPRQLEAILSGRGRIARGNHGIGFRVVRELVTASGGELRAASARGIGTRIQIDWPVAQRSATGRGNGGMMRERTAGNGHNPQTARVTARTSGDVAFRDGTGMEERQGAR